MVGSQAGDLHFTDVSHGSHVATHAPNLPGIGTIRAGMGIELLPSTIVKTALLHTRSWLEPFFGASTKDTGNDDGLTGTLGEDLVMSFFYF